jgi:putrescine transport system substrate-binding protein
MNRRYVATAILSVAMLCLFGYHNKQLNYEGEIVNVYGWYGIIPSSIFKAFERETGIKIIYDVYDNNDTLEAKLLATNSGYDIVFPSFIPYAARQCSMGIFSKLDKSQIPNFQKLEKAVTTKYEEAGGNLDYLVPIFWGTMGIVYDVDIMSAVFPGKVIDSYDVLFSVDLLKKVAKYGVSLPEEFIDIFPQARMYWNIKNKPKSVEDLAIYKSKFKVIRPYIKRFASNTVINAFLAGEICLGITSSDNALRLQRAARQMGRRIKFVIPREAGVIWFDCIAIPKKAPHKDNAYKFLNFLLNHKIVAKITNETGILGNIEDIEQYYQNDITNDNNICPDAESRKVLITGERSTSRDDLLYSKSCNKIWTQIKMNKFEEQ